MDQFIKSHCARDGSVRVSEFIRALRTANINTPRTEVIAVLARDFRLSNISGQEWIVGLSLRSNRTKWFRHFLNDNCIFADGLSCKLAALVRGASSMGLSRTEVIQHLQESGFEIANEGVYVVKGLGLKEPELVV